MRPFPPSFGDPVCPSCGGGPYTRGGRPKAFVMGICWACYGVARSAGISSPFAVTKRGPAKGPYVPHPRMPRSFPACAWPGCDGTAPTRAGRRCIAHKGLRLGPKVVRVRPLVGRVCAGCGVEVLRHPTNRPKHSFCSTLCRRYVAQGAWSVPSRVKPQRVPKIISKSPTYEFDCAWCAARASSKHPAARFCGRRCAEKSKNSVRWGREHGAPGVYSWTEVTRLWIKFDRRCAYCRELTSLDRIQAEHVLALSRGGRNDLVNILPSCGACNSEKGALSLQEWADLRRRKGEVPVVTSWNPTDPLYAHLRFDSCATAA